MFKNGDVIIVKNCIHTPTKLNKYANDETPIIIDGEVNKILESGEIYIHGCGKFVPEEFKKVR